MTPDELRATVERFELEADEHRRQLAEAHRRAAGWEDRCRKAEAESPE